MSNSDHNSSSTQPRRDKNQSHPNLITPPSTPIDSLLNSNRGTSPRHMSGKTTHEYLRPMSDFDMFHADSTSDLFAYQRLMTCTTPPKAADRTLPSCPQNDVHSRAQRAWSRASSVSRVENIKGGPSLNATSLSNSSPDSAIANIGQTWGAIPSRYLQVGNIPNDVSFQDVKLTFQQYGDIKGLFVKLLKSHGIVVIAFFDMRSSVKALRQLRHQIHFDNRRLEAQYCSRASLIQMFGAGNMPLLSPNEGELMISLLGGKNNTNQAALQALLAAYGDIRGFRVVGINPSKLVLVEFFDLRDAAAAKRELDGFTFEDAALHISFHEPDAANWQVVSQALQRRQDELSILDHFREISQQDLTSNNQKIDRNISSDLDQDFLKRTNGLGYGKSIPEHLTPSLATLRRGSTGSVIMHEDHDTQLGVVVNSLNPQSRLLRYLEHGRRTSNIYGADEYSVQKSAIDRYSDSEGSMRNMPNYGYFSDSEGTVNNGNVGSHLSSPPSYFDESQYPVGPSDYSSLCSSDFNNEPGLARNVIICEEVEESARRKHNLEHMGRLIFEQQEKLLQCSTQRHSPAEAERKDISSRFTLYNPPKNHEKNKIDLDRITRGLDTRTTIMIKNVPNKYTQQMLMDYIDATHPKRYDFFYLRIDFQNRCNVGYAFVNFIDPMDVVTFARKRVGTRWNRFHSDKICDISYANIQGKEALIDRFRNSSVMDEDLSYRPKIFYSTGPRRGDEEPFPASNDPKRKLRSIASAQTVGLFPPQNGRRVWHRRDTDDEADTLSSGTSLYQQSVSDGSQSRPLSVTRSEAETKF